MQLELYNSGTVVVVLRLYMVHIYLYVTVYSEETVRIQETEVDE